MPWPSFRHMSDAERWDIVAYLKHGLKPIRNKVTAIKTPKDHWASSYTVDKIGPDPLPVYPDKSEEFKP